MRGARKFSRQASLTVGFAVNMAILAVAGLVMIPALIGSVGPRDWADIAVAQAIGGFCGVITGFGWGLAGPAYVARADARNRQLRYFESVRGRLLVGGAVIPLGVVILSLVIGRFEVIPSLALIVTAAVAFSPAWFYVGIARPWTMIAVDTVPRALATGLAIVVLQIGYSPILALAFQLAGIAVGALVGSGLISRAAAREPAGDERPTPVFVVLRGQAHGMIAAGTSAAFTALPVVLVGIAAPAALSVYALFDKVQRQFASAVSPVVQVSQGYVARADPGQRRSAVMRVTLTIVAMSIGGVVIFSSVGTWFLHALVADTLRFSRSDVIVLGLAMALILTEQTFGHAVLATARRMKALSLATIIGAVVGLVLVTVGASSGGAVAALIGFEVGLAVAILLEAVFNYLSDKPSLAVGSSRGDEVRAR